MRKARSRKLLQAFLDALDLTTCDVPGFSLFDSAFAPY